MHTPRVETITYIVPAEPNIDNIKYFGRLTQLRSLDIRCATLSAEMFQMRAICKISEAKIPLQHLSFSFDNFDKFSAQLVDAVSKLKTLKTLVISTRCGLIFNAMQYICKGLPELEELKLIGNSMIDVQPDNLIEWIRCGEKLRRLYVYKPHTAMNANEAYCIDANVYMELVQILQERREKRHFTLDLNTRVYTLDVPHQLMSRYKAILTIVLI